MKNFKKLITVTLSVLVIAASVFSAVQIYASDSTFGTAENGITVPTGKTYNAYTVNNLSYAEGFNNGDFSSGLMYWGPYASSAWTEDTDATKYVDLVKEDSNSYIKFNTTEASKGIGSAVFTIPKDKLSVGDNLVLVYDYQGTATCMKLGLNQKKNASGTNALSSNSYAGDLYKATGTGTDVWNTAYTKASANKLAETAWSDGNLYCFRIEVETTTTTCTGSIDNIRIAKVVDGKYYDLDGTEMTFGTSVDSGSNSGSNNDESNNDDNDENKENETAASVFGTADKGIVVPSGETFNGYTVKSLAYAEGFNNGDFSEGLKYWAPYASSAWNEDTDADKYVKLVTEGTNSYIKFDVDESYKGIGSAVFTIPKEKLAVGDNLVLIYDYTDTSSTGIQLNLSQKKNKGGTSALSSKGFAADLYIASGTGTDIWNTAYTKESVNKLAETEWEDGNLYCFRIEIENTGMGLDGCVDNVRIAKLVGTNLYDLDGKLLYDTTADPEAGSGNGTVAPGNSGTNTGNGTSATTGDFLSIMPVTIAIIISAGAVIVIGKKCKVL